MHYTWFKIKLVNHNITPLFQHDKTQSYKACGVMYTTTVLFKGIPALHERKVHVLHAHYTQCPRTLQANTQKCMCNYAQ